MPTKPAPSKGELEVARVLWRLGEATPRQVHEAHPNRRQVDFTTVQTYLRRLEAKGYVRSRREGKTKYYSPRLQPGTVIRQTIDDFLNRLFDGQTLPLMRYLIRERGVSQEEIDQLRHLLADLEEQQHASPNSDILRLAWEHSWQVGAMVAAVGLVTALFCRRQPHLAYVLWLLVVLKCLTPPLWSSRTGVFNWMQMERTAPATEPAIAELPPAAPPTARVAMSGPVPAAEVEPVPKDPLSPPPTPAAPAGAFISWPIVAAGIWIAGVVALASMAALQWLRCWQQIRSTILPVPPSLAAVGREIAEQLGLRRPVRLIVTTAPIGPVTTGVLRPTVILPQAVLAGKDVEQIRPMLAHEMVHVRRRDVLFGLLQSACVRSRDTASKRYWAKIGGHHETCNDWIPSTYARVVLARACGHGGARPAEPRAGRGAGWAACNAAGRRVRPCR